MANRGGMTDRNPYSDIGRLFSSEAAPIMNANPLFSYQPRRTAFFGKKYGLLSVFGNYVTENGHFLL